MLILFGNYTKIQTLSVPILVGDFSSYVKGESRRSSLDKCELDRPWVCSANQPNFNCKRSTAALADLYIRNTSNCLMSLIIETISQREETLLW